MQPHLWKIPQTLDLKVNPELERLEGATSSGESPILLGNTECNALSNKDLSDRAKPKNSVKRCKNDSQLSLFDVREIVAAAKALLKRSREQAAMRQAPQHKAQLAISKAKLLQQMKGYLDPGDPILMAEALD